jgi:hypothetical protein
MTLQGLDDIIIEAKGVTLLQAEPAAKQLHPPLSDVWRGLFRIRAKDIMAKSPICLTPQCDVAAILEVPPFLSPFLTPPLLKALSSGHNAFPVVKDLNGCELAGSVTSWTLKSLLNELVC